MRLEQKAFIRVCKLVSDHLVAELKLLYKAKASKLAKMPMLQIIPRQVLVHILRHRRST